MQNCRSRSGLWLLGSVLLLHAPLPAACDVWVSNGPGEGEGLNLALPPLPLDQSPKVTVSSASYRSNGRGTAHTCRSS